MLGRPSPHRKPHAGFKWFVRNYKQAARIKGRAFEISDERMRELSSLPCTYCGTPPSRVSRRDCHDPYTYNGIDRIDSSLGYVEGNVTTCCFECNSMKGKLSVDVFMQRVHAIASWTK